MIEEEFQQGFDLVEIQKTKVGFLLSALLTMDPLIKQNFKLAKNLLLDICQSIPEQDEITLFHLAQLLLKIFIKENVTGKSWTFKDSTDRISTERLFKEQRFEQNDIIQSLEIGENNAKILNLEWFVKLIPLDKLFCYNINYLKLENCMNVTNYELLEHLNLGGETFNHLMKYKQLFFYSQQILQFLQQKKSLFLTIDLWLSRFNMLHNEILYLPVIQCQICIEQFNTFLDKIKLFYQQILGINQITNHYLCIIWNTLGFSYSTISTRKPIFTLNQLRNILVFILSLQVNQVFGLNFKRKKQLNYWHKQQLLWFQTQRIQKNCKKNVLVFDPLFNLVDSLPLVESVLGQRINPENVELDDECVIFDKPKLEQEQVEKNVKTGNLSKHEHVLLLALIENLHKTVARDEILQQQTAAYLDLMLDKSNNWLVFSKGLLLRSINEFSKYKRMERSLAQLQSLVDQFNDVEPNFEQRYELYFSLHYPDYYSLSRILGTHWMKVGGMQSGLEIFSRLEMWDDCIDCLVAQGELKKAAAEIEKFTKLGTVTMKMRCILGEINADVQILETVWKDSNFKFARAQRSLGEFYFFKTKDYVKSAEAYEKALEVNSYHANSYFVMACAYMRTEKLDKAIKAFGQCVSIDESNGEAWANMASCLQQQGNFNQAMSMLEQAAKYHEGDYRIWSNLMQLSLKNKKFNRFYSSIEKLIQLNHRSLIDENVLMKINQTFKYGLSIFETQTVRQLKFNRDRVDRLYLFLAKEIGQNYEVWEYYAQAVELFILAEQTLNEYELNNPVKVESINNDNSNINSENNTVAKNSQEQIYELLNKIADFRLKSCQLLMKIGWETEKATCQLLLEQIKKLVKSYEKIKTGANQKNLQMLINSVIPKIEETLEIKVDLK